MLAGTTESYASRHCLDEIEPAVRPTRTFVQTAGGCWDPTLHLPRGEVPNSMPEPLVITAEMRPERQPPEQLLTLGRFLLFVSAVLAVTAPAFAIWRPERNPPRRERSW
jgi:hypothetical protein